MYLNHYFELAISRSNTNLTVLEIPVWHSPYLLLPGSPWVLDWRLPQSLWGTVLLAFDHSKLLCLSGLQVILYINEDEYNPFLVSSTGAKVLIHQQNEYPFIEDVGTEIETAMSTSIGMHLVRGCSLAYV